MCTLSCDDLRRDLSVPLGVPIPAHVLKALTDLNVPETYGISPAKLSLIDALRLLYADVIPANDQEPKQ